MYVIFEGRGAPFELLDDPEGVERLLRRAVARLGGRILHLHVHAFDPQGVTAFALLAESHLAIHTWPETGCFAADLFFCGSSGLGAAVEEIGSALRPEQMSVRQIQRLPVSRTLPASRAAPSQALVEQ